MSIFRIILNVSDPLTEAPISSAPVELYEETEDKPIGTRVQEWQDAMTFQAVPDLSIANRYDIVQITNVVGTDDVESRIVVDTYVEQPGTLQRPIGAVLGALKNSSRYGFELIA